MWRSQVPDTQSGLRCMPRALFPPLIALRLQRYDWELAVLAHCLKTGRPVRNLPIQALYFDNNNSSHFRAVADSLIIAGTILRR